MVVIVWIFCAIVRLTMIIHYVYIVVDQLDYANSLKNINQSNYKIFLSRDSTMILILTQLR
jgi:hypothetical protein